MALMWEEKSVINLIKIYDLWRGSFKRFLLIPKTTNRELIDNMIGVHLTDIIVANSENSEIKWMIRKKEKLREDQKFVKVKKYNFLKGISNDWCHILKIQCRLCPVCLKSGNTSTMNSYHMAEHHNIRFCCYKEMWDEIKEYYLKKLEKVKKQGPLTRLKREIFKNRWTRALKQAKEEIQDMMRNHLVRNKQVNI